MKRLLIPILLLVLMSLSYAATSFGHDQTQTHSKDKWFIAKKDLICLKQELTNYLKQEGDQFVIFISECPDRDVVAILQRRTQNSGNQKQQETENTQLSPAEVITFTRKELECVATLQIETSEEVISIPKNPCQETQ